MLEAARAGEFTGLTLSAADGQPVLTAGDDRLGPVGPDFTDVAGRVRWMDARSIAEQWVSPWLDLLNWHRFGGTATRRWVAMVNDALADAACDSGGRLRAVPAVDLSAGATVAADDVTSLAERFAPPAVLLSTHPAGLNSVADPSLGPLWARLATLGMPVLLHPPGNGPAQAFTPPVLQNVAGRLLDTSSAVSQLMASGVFERLPALRVIVVHGGAILPYQIFRLDGLVRAGLLARTGMTEPPSAVLRRLFFDTVALDGLSIEFLARRVGHGQILLGSDAPFPIADPDPVGTVGAAGLTADAERAICDGNARSLAWQTGRDQGAGTSIR